MNFSQSFLPFWTFFRKEVIRFISVPLQTLVAPVVTASLYLFVFGVNLGERLSIFEDYSYLQFVIPGLICMSMVNNSFGNISSSLFFSRYIGNIVDVLVTPISPAQLILAYTLAAILRGLMVSAAVFLVSTWFTDLPWVYPFRAVSMLLCTGFMFSQLGLIAAIYSESFENLSMFTNFLILPLIYLGGLFYPISELPPIWGSLSQLNPLYYVIDGFRHAILGSGELSFLHSFGVVGLLSFGFFVWGAILIRSGYKLRN